MILTAPMESMIWNYEAALSLDAPKVLQEFWTWHCGPCDESEVGLPSYYAAARRLYEHVELAHPGQTACKMCSGFGGTCILLIHDGSPHGREYCQNAQWRDCEDCQGTGWKKESP